MGHSTMYIECAKGFVLSSTVEARYQQALKVPYSAVIVPLIQSLLMNLDTGAGFQIGGVTFDKDGLHRSSSLGAIQKGVIGAWASLTAAHPWKNASGATNTWHGHEAARLPRCDHSPLV